MEWGWKCLLCDARPHDVSWLQRHILIHLGLQPNSANVKKCFSNNNNGGPSWNSRLQDDSFERSSVWVNQPQNTKGPHEEWRSRPHIGRSDLERPGHHSNVTNMKYTRPRQPAILKMSTNPQSAPIHTIYTHSHTHNLKETPISITNIQCPSPLPGTDNIVKQQLLHAGYRFILPQPGPMPSACNVKKTTIRNDKTPFRLCDQTIKVVVDNKYRPVASDQEEYTITSDLEQAKLYNGDKTCMCDVCDEEFKHPASLRTHCIMHTEVFKCDSCDKFFNCARHLEIHQALCTRDKRHKCDICDEAFSHTSRLKPHGEKTFKCDRCDSAFTDYRTLQCHYRIHTGKKLSKCAYCDEVFICTSRLRDHQAVHSKVKSYKCDVCDKVFTQGTSLKLHYAMHTGQRMQCDVCDKAFSHATQDLKWYQTMQREKRLHTTYKCDLCEMIFDDVYGLRFHVLMKHTELHHCNDIENKDSGLNLPPDTSQTIKRPFKCELCDKTFSYFSSLRHHRKLHTGEKPHKCDLCDKAFTYAGNLKQHRIVHTKEKPHQCDRCDKAFSQGSCLKRHYARHTREMQ